MKRHIRATVSPADRPLRRWNSVRLHAAFEQALATADGVLGAHCLHELWMQGLSGLNVDAALERLWERAAASIPEWLPMRHFDWLPIAYQVSARFRADATGRSNIYLVLLDYRDRRGQPYGAYVGMSHYSPARRFDQHKAGIRSAGSVLRRGLEVLTGPTLHLQHIARADAERIEVQFAEALRDAGLHVEGGH